LLTTASSFVFSFLVAKKKGIEIKKKEATCGNGNKKRTREIEKAMRERMVKERKEKGQPERQREG
jgi:hypothetical protein